MNLYGFGVDDRNVGRGWRNQLPSALPPEAKYQYYVLRGTERSGVDAVHSMELEHAILDGLVGAGYINRCGAGKETCGLNPRKKIGRLGNRKDLLKAESMFNAREIMMRERASKGKEEKRRRTVAAMTTTSTKTMRFQPRAKPSTAKTRTRAIATIRSRKLASWTNVSPTTSWTRTTRSQK